MGGGAMREHLKVVEGDKVVWKMIDREGRPVREVETVDWDLDMYINYCIYPIQNCINRMQGIDEPDSKIQEFVDMLDRLYDAARVQLYKMADAIYEDMGRVQIITTNENSRGGFLQQDFLEAYIKEKPEKEVVNA